MRTVAPAWSKWISIPIEQPSGRFGAHFGIDYVLERIPKRKLFPKGATIHVESIQGHAVDTTNLVIAYAAANALLHALDLEASETKKPNFDKEHGLFVFP